MQKADRELLQKYYDNSCSSEEFTRAQELLNTEEGIRFFENLSLETWQDNIEPDQRTRSMYQHWKRNVHRRIAEIENRPIPKNKLRLFTLAGKAAVWIGVLLVSSYLIWKWQGYHKAPSVVIIEGSNEHGAPIRYVLPDSSQVYLAAGSTIRYSEKFGRNGRNIDLRGEAFFQVTPDPANPFIVNTGKMSTKVLGTSFKVSAYDQRPKSVEVATGKVSVYATNDHTTKDLGLLTAGLTLTYDEMSGLVEKGHIEVSNLDDWKTGDMVFVSKPMGVIAQELGRRYGVSITCADQRTAEYRVTASFGSGESVEQILRLLSKMGKFKFENKDNKIYTLYKTR